jgi:flavin reductase (DIM6/NTAB) family NADH-FMN oxidoreductase RutF
MPKLHADMLTGDLHRRLSGVDVGSLASHAIVLCTTDADGQPHPAMLSYFEVAAPDRHNLRLAVYNDSRTFTNLRERGKATLIVVDVDLVCYIRGTVDAVAPSMRGSPYNAKLNLRIEQVEFDAASLELEPGANVTSGITYGPRTAEALARAHAVLEELLDA